MGDHCELGGGGNHCEFRGGGKSLWIKKRKFEFLLGEHE